MPIYEFVCECGNEFELITSIDARPPDCKKCGRQTERLVGTLAFFRMKGEPNGSTRGVRMYAEELTKKHRK